MLFAIASSIVSVLLGIIAYFLKEIYSEFKEMKNQLNSALTRLAVAEERSRTGYKELNYRIDGIEKRVERIEIK